MHLQLSILAFFFLQICVFSIQAQTKEEGKLADFEKEVEEKSEHKSSSYSVAVDFSYDDEIDLDDSVSVASAIEGAVMMIGLGYYSTKTALNILFAFPAEIDNGIWEIGYSDYPYSNNSEGLFDRSSLKKYSVYSSLSYFRESGSLNAIHFNTRLSPTPVLALEINYSDFTEKLTSRYDHLRIYDIFLNYNRLKFDSFAFWWGLGYKGLLGDRSHGGFAINFGSNIFLPDSPVSLGLNYNAGFFESTTVHDFSPKIRYHINRAEISLGYRLYKAGQVSINGWTVGLGLYL